MENIRRISQYLRTPLVYCGAAQTLVIPQTPSRIDEIPEHFYRLFGKSWEHIVSFKEALRSDAFILRSATGSFNLAPKETQSDSVTNAAGDSGAELFRNLSVARLDSFSHTESTSLVLEEGKRIVPLILNWDGKSNIASTMEAEYGFLQAGEAEGPGFTCAVYRKQMKGGRIPLYIISGELDVSSREFHALACDLEYRKNWDDQLHAVSASEIEKNICLVKWVVKWPWPLAPREYTYLLSPHILADGTSLVMSTGIDHNREKALDDSAVAVKEYFGITASKSVGEGKCRYCVFYFDDPRLPGQMPAWLEQYVTKQVLPSFPLKLLKGAKGYPAHRLERFE